MVWAGVQSAVIWMLYISSTLLLAEILLPLGVALYRASHTGSALLIYIVGSLITVKLMVIGIAYSSLLSQSAADNGFLEGTETIIDLQLAYYALYFICSLVAIAMLITLTIMMRGKVQNTPIASVAILCFMLFGLAITSLVISARNHAGEFPEVGGYVVQGLFQGGFLLGVYIMLLIVGEHSTVVAAANGELPTSQHDPTSATGPMPTGQPGQHPITVYPMYQQHPGQPGQPGQPMYSYPQGQPMVHHQQAPMYAVPGQQPPYYQPGPIPQQHPTGHQPSDIAPAPRSVSPLAAGKTELNGEGQGARELESPREKGNELP